MPPPTQQSSSPSPAGLTGPLAAGPRALPSTLRFCAEGGGRRGEGEGEGEGEGRGRGKGEGGRRGGGGGGRREEGEGKGEGGEGGGGESVEMMTWWRRYLSLPLLDDVFPCDLEKLSCGVGPV